MMVKNNYSASERARIKRAFMRAKNAVNATANIGRCYISVQDALEATALSKAATHDAICSLNNTLHPYMSEHAWLRSKGARYITDKKLHQWRLMWLDKLIKEFS